MIPSFISKMEPKSTELVRFIFQEFGKCLIVILEEDILNANDAEEASKEYEEGEVVSGSRENLSVRFK